MEVGMTGREARRKRIVERGSDRFALITGRIQTLNHDDNNNNNITIPHHSHTRSSPTLILPKHVNLKGGGEQDDDNGGNAIDNETKTGPQLRKCETATETIRGSRAMELDKVQLSHVTARVPKASENKESLPKASGGGNYFFTSKEINSCIIASENTRVFCSIMIALLVILSYVNLPRKIVKSNIIISSEPLYVLLLTNISVVVGLLVLEKRRVSEKAKEEARGAQDDRQNWEGAVMFLELGLLLHQALRAVFIDCCFYVVIIVCGFSMM